MVKHVVSPEHRTSLPDPQIDGEGLSWQARMTVLHDSYGFVPTTGNERNVAFGAIPFMEGPGGVGKHLNEVLRHQQKAPGADQPDRSVRALVRSMDAFRMDALYRRGALRASYDTLREANPKLDIAQVDGIPLLGKLSIVQHFRILEGIRNGDLTPLSGGIKDVPGGRRLVTGFDPETHDETTAEMLMETLPDTGVLAVRGIVLEAGKSHRSRAEFWKETLTSSKTHAQARPLVEEILG